MPKKDENVGTITAAQEKIEEIALASPEAIAKLSDTDIIELTKLYRISSPIHIPVDKLDSNYEYRWVNKADMKNFRRRQGVGWRPVNREMLEKMSKVPLEALNMGTGFTPDGYMCIADDLVLACIPKRIAQVIKDARAKTLQDKLKAGKAQFHDAGKLAGIETFEKF